MDAKVNLPENILKDQEYITLQEELKTANAKYQCRDPRVALSVTPPNLPLKNDDHQIIVYNFKF